MAAKIPREFIQTLLGRINIIDLISDRGVPLQKKSGSNYFASCPFHTEKSGSFSVSQTKQFYHCFGCGVHGNAIDFLIAYDRLNFPEAVETLARQIGLDIPREAGSHTPTTPAVSPDLYALMEKISRHYQQALRRHPAAIDYLKQRGLTGEIARQFGLGFAPDSWDNLLRTLGTTPALREQLHTCGMLIKKDDGGYYDRFRDRIQFPIHDRRGRIIGFGGRIIQKGEPKYLNSPETPLFHKGNELYGLYHAQQAHRKLTRILIVEGYMDVIALYQHGVNFAVATLGTATTPGHLQQLFRHTPEIIFCFDGDAAGRTAAWRALTVALPLMTDGRTVRFLFLPDGEDPDTLVRKIGYDAFLQKLATAEPLSQFFFQSLAAQVDMAHLDGRARLASLAMEHMKQIPTGIFQHMMQDELARLTRMDSLRHAAPPPTPRKSAPPKTANRPLSPLRLAITLLTQRPALASTIDEPLPAWEGRGMDLLQKICALLHAQPTLTTAGLLENFRDTESIYTILAKLASIPLTIPEDGYPAEFQGALRQLHRQQRAQTIEQLIAKAKSAPLNSDEKATLNALIRSKN